MYTVRIESIALSIGFGECEIVEDDGAGKQVVSISVSPAKWENAKRKAAQLGIGISEYIESLL